MTIVSIMCAATPLHKEVKEDDTHHRMEQPGMFVVKLCGYLTHSKDRDGAYYVNKDYYDTCDVLPLKFGEGFTGRTLQTHEPHFCKDLSSLTGQNGLSGILSCMTKCSGLALCLRSTHTGQGVDYVFEFLWPQNRNQIILLESLLVTLKMCLPSFKFASGAQLGDELQVLNVGCEISPFKILQGNRFSQISKESREAKELYRPFILPTKKLSDLYVGDNQTDSESDMDTDSDADPLGCSDSGQTFEELSEDKLC